MEVKQWQASSNMTEKGVLGKGSEPRILRKARPLREAGPAQREKGKTEKLPFFE